MSSHDFESHHGLVCVGNELARLRIPSWVGVCGNELARLRIPSWFWYVLGMSSHDFESHHGLV